MSEHWIVNSDHTEAAFIANLRKLRAEHGYITFSAPRIGKDRSISQNGLFHLWATEYAAHLLGKDKKSVTKGELAGMKRIIKQRFNASTPNNFMVHDVTDPFTGNTKRDYTSSSDWKVGEAFMVMEWLQLYAANDGLILEAIGQFEKLIRKGAST
jgi:hypothetical protein